MAVIRISKASFAKESYADVKARLDESRAMLEPAIRALRGCLNYWAAIDPVTNTMVNVSMWETRQDAKQLDRLTPMLALAGEFVSLGVSFEAPITNSDVLWEL
ncbi:MAG TPA: hypothetical protein VIV40_33540 [Kofleriaceae bacterium]